MIRAALLFLIRLYQMTLSRLIGPSCRFEPSCSRYTATCIERFGALRGSWMGIKRIARCHPFHPGGYDPPPPIEVDAGPHQRHEVHRG
jgi:putative membrane protein insertion efficiency factor